VKVLLSSPITPMPKFQNGRDHLRYNYANTTYGQDIFSIPTITHYYGLHLIAQNISKHTKILEDPTQKNFISEVKQKYDIVGIYFVIPFFSKVVQMCQLVREHAPESIIVLGGPGVQCFSHSTGKEDELLGIVDHVCHGDGIPFMRQMFNEDPNAPVCQDLPLGGVLPFRSKFLKQSSPIIISALGCSNSCEFCAGSAFFGHKVKRLVNPSQLLEIIRKYISRYKINGARIIDDNFLYDKNYVKELGYLIKNDELCQECSFTYSVFGNLAVISQYDYEELVEYGVSGILIGVESKFVDNLDQNIKRKLINIDTYSVFQNLHEHGICTEGSMILGWDFHTPENIMEDIDFYVSLQATFDQILCLTPLPETKLWRKLKQEGRLLKDISWDDCGFYAKWHRYKNFSHEQLWEYEALTQKKCFETWGPSYLRLVDVCLKGYRKFVSYKDPCFQRVAKAHKRDCELIYPLLLCIDMYAPSEKVKKIIEELKQEYIQEFGKPAISENLKALAAAVIASQCKIKSRLFKEDTVQPRCKVFSYN